MLWALLGKEITTERIWVSTALTQESSVVWGMASKIDVDSSPSLGIIRLINVYDQNPDGKFHRREQTHTFSFNLENFRLKYESGKIIATSGKGELIIIYIDGTEPDPNQVGPFFGRIHA